MVKLFLVEDEIIMRDGIKKHIDWKGEDIEFVGEASDGELAYPLILKTKPDIVVTDIKMPFMDGLQLSKMIKKDNPDVHIIILSGYDEFTYAQEAVSIGVDEYLLKPISPSNLLVSIKKLKTKIELEKTANDQIDWSKEAFTERNIIEQQKLFQAIVSGSMSMPDLLSAGKKLNIDLTAQFYQVAVFKYSLPGEIGDVYSEKQNLLLGKVTNFINEIDECCYFDRGTEGFALLVMGESDKGVTETMTKVIEQLKIINDEVDDADYFCGLGSVVNRLSEVGKSYDDANWAFSYRYFREPNQVVKASDLDAARRAQVDVDVNAVNTNEKNRKVFEKFLRSGSANEVNHFIEEIFSSYDEKNVKSLLFLNYIVMDLYFAIVSFIRDLGYDTKDLGSDFADINTAVKSISNFNEAEEYLCEGLEKAIKLRDSNSVKKYSVVLKKVIAYIDDNFEKDDISLNTVASIANISPNHFSTIFSQEVGVTFIEYLIGKRMDKAKELLMTTNLRSSEIAYKVGYKDPHYFSFMFKKTQGMTTREYRSRGKN
ncbi:two-component system, response regulator YesN [Lachnospiraceae bacterium KH1T2]|nr:two-component system, response regulator YesN [Lachnospiraceae bacterium KH1T2]